MESIESIIQSNYFILAIAIVNVILLMLYIFNALKLRKINKNYRIFMKKLGNGNNIDEMLKKYIERVEEVNEGEKELKKYCSKLKEEISFCIKKVGMVRYSAFRDTGSDLSFALALLNDHNDGIILNGIYSREMSNIYAKQVQAGKTINKLSDEEKQALEIALSQEN